MIMAAWATGMHTLKTAILAVRMGTGFASRHNSSSSRHTLQLFGVRKRRRWLINSNNSGATLYMSKLSLAGWLENGLKRRCNKVT